MPKIVPSQGSAPKGPVPNRKTDSLTRTAKKATKAATHAKTAPTSLLGKPISHPTHGSKNIPRAVAKLARRTEHAVLHMLGRLKR